MSKAKDKSANLTYSMTEIDALIPYARNSRTHSGEQVAQIAASIKEFGFLNPVIVASDGTIIAGHGRVLAARQLGLKEVPTLLADHLSDAQRRAYIIADNKLALNAGWDDDLLKIELDDLRMDGVDLELTGFSDKEIAALFADPIEKDHPEVQDSTKWLLVCEFEDEASLQALFDELQDRPGLIDKRIMT